MTGSASWDRVAAVTGPGGPASGYFVGPRLVLTSGHAVRAVGNAVTVFRPGRAGEFAGAAVWCGTPGGRDDAALVLVEDSRWVPFDGDVPWGRTVTHRAGIECVSWGVPDLVQRPGLPVDVSQLTGRLNAGDRMVADRYVMAVDGHPPSGVSPWGGLSGAAMFCGDLLTGVIAVDPAGREHAALEAVPAYVLLGDPEFRALLAAHGGSLRCAAVEWRELDGAAERFTTREMAASPSGLLAARNEVVPFVGREEELAGLRTWAASSGIGVFLLHGPGGQGKTRLAQRFGDQLAAEGWEVVWPRQAADARRLSVIGDAVVPVLVVLDYAEGRLEQLATLFAALGRHPEPPVKVLLLTRTVGEWWSQLAASDDAVGDICDSAVVRALPALEPEGVDLYRGAVLAYATALTGVPGVDWAAVAARLAEAERPPRVADSTVLAAHMSALADLLDAVSTPNGPDAGPRGPEDRVLDHERRHWQSAARTLGLLPGLSTATLVDVIASVALLGPPTRDDADGFLARVPGLADQPRDRRDTVRAWLGGLYPAVDEHTAFGILQPDRLAERLVGRLMLDRSRTCVVEALAPRTDYAEARLLLTVCTRAAAHPILGDGVAEALTRWCVEHADTLALPALTVTAQAESPGPLLAALDQLGRDETLDVELLRHLGNALPVRTEVLADVALTIADALLPIYQANAARDPERNADGLAMALCGLSDRLSDVGRYEEALAAVVDGVEILRQVTDRRPDFGRPLLAGGLRRLANRLLEVGRVREALDVADEANGINRDLVARQPEIYTADLVVSMNTYASCLAALGRHQESMASMTENVALLRQLTDSGGDDYLPALADALTNLANWLTRLDRYEDALAAITESVDLRRPLADRRPDAHLADLANGLNTLAIVLGRTGRHTAALATAEESVHLYRDLAAARPGVHDNALARGLLNLSLSLYTEGRYQDAVEATVESVRIRRALAADLPDAYRADLASSLHVLADELCTLGMAKDALPAIVESVGIRFDLAQELPEAHVHRIVAGLQIWIQCHLDLGQNDQAVPVIDQLVDLRHQIAEVEDDHATQDPEIATALTVRAQLLAKLDADPDHR